MARDFWRWVPTLVVAFFASSLAWPARAEAPISENANRRFNEGVRYLTSQDPDRYEKAYREFKAAYADSPSWKILGNLGIVAHQLERDGEAIDAFERYLEEGGKELSKDDRHQFSEDLKLVESGCFTVKIESVPEGAWIVDERLPDAGRPVVNRYGPTSGPLELRLRAGHHRIRAERSGYETDDWEFSDKAGAEASHVFELRRTKQPKEAVVSDKSEPFEDRREAKGGGSGVRIASYVAMGLGVAAAGVGTYFWFDAQSLQEEADGAYARCAAESVLPDGTCNDMSPSAPGARGLDQDEKSARKLAIGTYGAAGGLLITGLILFLVSDGGGSSEAPEAEESAWIEPWIDLRGVGVNGRF